jgi:Glycosyltransferase family 87
VTGVSSLLERGETVAHGNRTAGSRLLLVGAVTFAAVLTGWLVYARTHVAPATIDPADLQVYKNGGLIIRHVSPTYNPALKYPLHDWPKSKIALKFTYTPFAAAAALVTEPVFRTMYLGQINLLLMAAIIGDLRQPDRRRFKGVTTGLAAGIKLVPLVFIPYLLLTRRFRAAAMTASAFAVTAIIGFIVVPGDSDAWWLHGLFLADGRTGFVGWGVTSPCAGC